MNKKYLISKNGITYHSKSRGLVTIPKTQHNYPEILDYLLNPEFDENSLLKLVDDKDYDIEKASKGKIKKNADGSAAIGKINIPKNIMNKINTLKSKGFDWKHYKKFWENCLNNPNPKSVNLLFEFLEKYNFTITEDGCFLAYKGVREDYKDVHSGTFDNSPGQVVEMDRNEVVFDPEETCSRGLHCGALQYARNWGPLVVLVKVNPIDVVSVPVDHDAQKIRVCKYVVESVHENNVQHFDTVVGKDNKGLKIHNNRITKWTPEEELILWKAVSKADSSIGWVNVSKTLKRSKDACRKKYAQLKKNPPQIAEPTIQQDQEKEWKPMSSKSSKESSKSWSAEDIDNLIHFRNANMSFDEIAKRLNRTVSACRKRFWRLNK